MHEEGGTRFTPTAPSAWKRFRKAMTKRPDRGHIAIGLLIGLLAFAATLQVRADDDDALANARQDDLVQILDGLTRQSDRLEDQVAELEADRRELLSGADTEQAALRQAQERAKSIGILAGTVEARGPGIVMTITDPDRAIGATVMLSAIQELRDAGAEAIQIKGLGNDTAVRVVLNTFFLNPQPDVLNVGGVEVAPPYQITAIGDAETLAGAMSFSNGVVSKVQAKGATATVTEHDDLVVDVLHELAEPKYAKPAPEEE